MAVLLEGGCRVTEMREGEPLVRGTITSWRQVGRSVGAQAVSLRVVEFASGLSEGVLNRDCDEVAYVLEGAATIFIDGHSYSVEQETAFFVGPNEVLTIENSNTTPLVLISTQCPEPREDSEYIDPVTAPFDDEPRPAIAPVVRLADREAVETADRWFRLLVDDEVGSKHVTQFIGSIPPGRATDHSHTYEEVLFILGGEGRMWAGETSAPIGKGSCIYLPPTQVHCVENTGTGELRLLGVFYPAGSPAARQDTE